MVRGRRKNLELEAYYFQHFGNKKESGLESDVFLHLV
jgi:hypothetical protein